MKNRFFFNILFFLLFFTTIKGNSIYNNNSIKLDSIIYQYSSYFIIDNRNEGEENMKYLVFVLNVVEMDTLQNSCEFSISYIRNYTEIPEVHPIGYIKIKNEIILVRAQNNIETIKNKLKILVITKDVVTKIKDKLCDDTLPYSGITYRADYLVVMYKNDIIESEKYPDEFNIDKKFWIQDFNFDMKDFKIKKIPIDSFPY